MRRRALVVTGAVAAVLVAVLAGPFLAGDRVLPAAVPQPPPLYGTALVPLEPGARACIRDATVDEHSELAQIKVGTRGRAAVPLSVTMTARGFRRELRRPADYRDNEVLALPLRPPAEPLAAIVCVRNEGARAVDLYGAADRSHTRSQTYVEGRLVPANFELSFRERAPASFLDRAGTIAERVATWRPGGGWVPLVVAVLVLIGVPVGLTVAIAAAAADDEAPSA